MRSSRARHAAAVIALLTAAAPHHAAGQDLKLASLERPAPAPVPPAPAVRESYEFYDVRGGNWTDLREDLRRNSSVLSDGSRYDALTRWDVRWEYGHDHAPGSCSVSAFQAIVDISFRYPRWDQENEAPPALREVWSNYLENLVRHESGHREIAVAAASALSRAASMLPPAPTCADLDRTVLALGSTLMRQLHLDQQSYDRETAHGAVQGAVLP